VHLPLSDQVRKMIRVFLILLALEAIYVLAQFGLGFWFLHFGVKTGLIAVTEAFRNYAGSNGLLMIVAMIPTDLLCLILLIFYVNRTQEQSLAQYFHLRTVPWNSVGFWLGLTSLYLVVAYFADTSGAGEDVAYTFQTVRSLALFWVLLAVLGPVYEEMLYRGFLITELSATHLRQFWVVLIPAVIWTIGHVEFDPGRFLFILGLGILLGYARVRTGSLILPIGMHSFVNAVVTILQLWELRGR